MEIDRGESSRCHHKYQYDYSLNYDYAGNVISLDDIYSCVKCGAYYADNAEDIEEYLYQVRTAQERECNG
jgi:hypothetical protein